MKAMIMAAGVGSRLMPLTKDTPKPMVPMANRPLMENIVELLAHHNFNEVIANLHHQGEAISGYFKAGQAFGIDLHYSPEEKLLGTAGGVKKCSWFLDDSFVVISGDALTDIDLSKLCSQHRKCGALATIALKEVENVEQFGVVVTAKDGRISRFQEKPAREEALSRQANTGIYVFEPEIFTYIPADKFYDFGRQLFPRLVEMGAPFYGVSIEDYWCDVGSIETYRQAHIDVLQGDVKMKAGGIIKGGTEEACVLLGEGVEIRDEVKLQGYVVIGKNCRIGHAAVIRDAIIWEQSEIGAASVLQDCIIGRHCKIGPGSIINPGTVIGSFCETARNSVLSSSQDLIW